MLNKSNFNKTNVHKFKKNQAKIKQLKIDEMDKQILRVLISDCRLPYREVARRINVSPTTVMYRLQKLLSNKVIQGYSVITDPKKLGYNLTAIILVTLKEGETSVLEDEIVKLPYVFGVYTVSGRTDTVIIARFKDTIELSTFIRSLQKAGYTERTETLLVLDTLKEDFRVVL